MNSSNMPLPNVIDGVRGSVNNNNNVFNSYGSTPRYIQCNLIYEKKKKACKNEFNMVNGTTPPLIAC